MLNLLRKLVLPSIVLMGLFLSGCSKPEQTKILFLGDTGFGESYGAIDLDELGYDYSFENFKGILGAADYTLLNLETPLTDLKDSPYEGEKDYIHWSDPVKGPQTLADLGVDAVSLANNHTLDYGEAGLKQTMDVLDQAGIEHIGAGMNEPEASEPLIKEFQVGERTFRMAVIAAYQYAGTYYDDYKYYAEDEKSGVKMLEIDPIVEEIKKLDQEYPGIYIVVFPHWGTNYRWKNPGQFSTMVQLVDAGADMIVGQGAHMLQEVERYGNKWIAYNLGNFVFNSPGRYAKEKGAIPYSLIMEMVLEDDGGPIRPFFRFYPIYSDNLQTNYQSRFVTRSEFNQVWDELDSPGEKGKDEFGYYFEIRRD